MELGWIDFSKSERTKVLSVLDLLAENGTLDEMCIGPVRDAFSNIFFPGTSTIQTRAKYFLIVPYALKMLERSSETNPRKLLNEFDYIEENCGRIFFDTNRYDDGIIGKRSLASNKWVKRAPSDIYWSGIKKYEIFSAKNVSIKEYIRVICAQKSQKSSLNKLGNRNDNAEENECDDKNAGDIAKLNFWNLPTYTDNWMDKLSISLTHDEGVFLKNQIISCCPDSLMAFVMKNNKWEILGCDAFETLSDFGPFPEKLQEYYEDALKFSDFAYVLKVIYNLLTSDNKNEYAIEELAFLSSQFNDISNVDIDGIMNRLGVFSNPMLRNFLNQSKALMSTSDIDGLKKCIVEREICLKGTSRAKTIHPGEFNPEVWIGGGKLDYRFYNAKVILQDIFDSEVKKNV